MVAANRADLDRSDFHEAWVAALDVIELDVKRSEELLRSSDGEIPELAPWTPPIGIGALPLSLIDRVRALHERQLAVSAVLITTIAGNRKQSAFADAMDSTRPESRPVFVDRAC